eukprot:1713275-Prorocentrum_lima.AAC.1
MSVALPLLHLHKPVAGGGGLVHPGKEMGRCSECGWRGCDAEGNFSWTAPGGQQEASGKAEEEV